MTRAALPKAALLAAALLAMTACAAPDDETWMQIVGVGVESTRETDTSTTTTFSSSSVIESDLQNRETDTVDVEVQNSTIILGDVGGGVSITVYHATVEYFVQGHTFPSYQYTVTLFLPAPTSGDAGAADSTETLIGLPLVPTALKDWILDPANFPPEIAARGFTGEARITLRGRTEEGRELDVSSSVTVVFN
jgi:hypothetical protein